ncbi:PD-(D/E)XK nuclease family protein [Natrinema zhouii]|uniref:PD-(D/E)XK nuclease family protein n=1 Tax=Natrinema zhouii TaxID=1710539 RepID=A0A7D6GWU1_9EURY|nr:PD-(D/E)XK nuclease family protein [Natrinema zhouii]QLK27504.1 PD-(D/E)XK nuclease family protein [Natrinema zhouii]
MTETDGNADAATTHPALSVDGLRTALHCPRRYEFAHVHGLEGSEDDVVDDRVSLLRSALCDALRSGETEREALETAASDRLSTLWNDHDERFHSRTQRRHERRVLEATLAAYAERVGADHAAGIARLDAEAARGELIGPGLPLSGTSELSTQAVEPDAVTIDATVDYVYGDGSSIVGVRFVPTLAPLGRLRYRSDWTGDVEELFTEHFDADSTTFEPAPVGALFETAVVLDGLRALRDRLELGDRTCRYVQIPLADRSGTAVNWVRETVETSLEIVDLTDVYIDHHTFGMTHEHRNETVDDRLAAVAASLLSGPFDPSDRWDRIADNSCPDCEYTVCCQEYIAEEVRFDG